MVFYSWLRARDTPAENFKDIKRTQWEGKGAKAKDICYLLDQYILLDFSLASSWADGKGGRPGLKNRRKDEVQLQCTCVNVHTHLTVHANIPHADLLHPLTLQANAIHVHVRLGNQVHSNTVHPDTVQQDTVQPDTVQYATLHPVALHLRVQDCIDVRALVQQNLALQFDTAHASTGNPRSRDTCRTCKEDCALSQ